MQRFALAAHPTPPMSCTSCGSARTATAMAASTSRSCTWSSLERICCPATRRICRSLRRTTSPTRTPTRTPTRIPTRTRRTERIWSALTSPPSVMWSRTARTCRPSRSGRVGGAAPPPPPSTTTSARETAARGPHRPHRPAAEARSARQPRSPRVRWGAGGSVQARRGLPAQGPNARRTRRQAMGRAGHQSQRIAQSARESGRAAEPRRAPCTNI
mmetsp:Transcript_13451/g.30550  ORF Transcript_13451/g.30550 Transcript_13451/m.30550 type:complete len:215 (-) Transcript_13451:111-755(-)